MEITTQPRWSGVVLCNDPVDPEHGLAQLGLMFKLCVCVRMFTWLYACTCIHVSAYHPVHFLRACLRITAPTLVFYHKNLTAVHMQTLRHVHPVHYLCCIYHTVFVLCVRLSRSCFLS